MKKKILFGLLLTFVMCCLFVISASAETLYKESAEGDAVFACTFDDKGIVTDYVEGQCFPKYDANGNALTWYLTGETDTDAEGNTVKYVTSVMTKDVFDVTKGHYTNSTTFSHTVVSANFDNDVTFFGDSLFGSYGTYSKELLFVYIPESVTSIGERFCQKVPSVLCIEFAEGSKCTSIGKHFALWAYGLRKVINFPAGITSISMAEGCGMFQETTNLETVTFAPNSQLTHVGGQAFYGSGLQSITLPNSVKSVGTKAFQNCTRLTYLNLGAGFTTFKADFNDFFSFTMGAPSTIRIVMPGNEIILDENGYENSTKLFGYLFSSAVNFEYAGTQEQFEAFKTVINESGYTNNGGLNKSTVTYVSKCDAFYGGHKLSTYTLSPTVDFFKTVEIYGSCTSCGDDVLVSTVDAIFEWIGYSCSETADKDGCYSVTQAFKINTDAVEEYERYIELDYGVLAAVNDTGAAIAPSLQAENVVSAPLNNIEHSYFEIKVTGIPSARTDAFIVFCAYVAVGDSVYYLDKEATLTNIVGNSYNSIL